MKDRITLENDIESEYLVIFIHGLGGDANTFIESIDKPNDLIKFIFKDPQIRKNYTWGVFDYYTRILNNFFWSRWVFGQLFKKKIRSNLSIENMGEILNTEIKIRCSKYKKIAIVGHSMGGLIVKEAILADIENSENRIDLFISLGVPHLGSNWANFAQNFSPSIQLKELGNMSDYTSKLSRRWKHNSNLLPPVYYFTSKQDHIVNYYSAANGLENVDNIVSVVKEHDEYLHPKSKDDSVVMAITNYLKQIIDKPINPDSITCEYPSLNQTIKGVLRDPNTTAHRFYGKIKEIVPNDRNIWIFYKPKNGQFNYPKGPIVLDINNMTWDRDSIGIMIGGEIQIFFVSLSEIDSDRILGYINRDNPIWYMPDLPKDGKILFQFSITSVIT